MLISDPAATAGTYPKVFVAMGAKPPARVPAAGHFIFTLMGFPDVKALAM